MEPAAPQCLVGALVVAVPARARVFEAFGIDYCRRGRETLADAADRACVDVEVLLAALARVDARTGAPCRDWAKVPAAELCREIVEVHHRYLRAALPRIAGLLQQAIEVEAVRHPLVAEVRDLFDDFGRGLEAHLVAEEELLFPLVARVEQQEGGRARAVGWMAEPIHEMLVEHDHAGDELGRIRSLTRGYSAPPEPSPSYQQALGELRVLERDTQRHVHKENNILFPRFL